MNEKIRLNRYLASLGVGSRRKVNELIKMGKIKVNGLTAQLNHRIDPASDQIFADRKEVKAVGGYIYILLNKPKGVISTTSDEFGRKSVIDLVKSDIRVYPVGRLDSSTTGLIILTNDGDLTYQLTHPKFNVDKTYQLVVTGEVNDGVLSKLQNGTYLREHTISPAQVRVINKEGNRTILELTIHQGWNHQVKKMCGVLGLNLINLKIIAIGTINLENLESGKYRNLTSQEVESLKKLV